MTILYDFLKYFINYHSFMIIWIKKLYINILELMCKNIAIT